MLFMFRHFTLISHFSQLINLVVSASTTEARVYVPHQPLKYAFVANKGSGVPPKRRIAVELFMVAKKKVNYIVGCCDATNSSRNECGPFNYFSDGAANHIEWRKEKETQNT
jgi:hypothetical protein